MLRGCKAWLLCGEKQWLRTGAPPADVIPAAPEGTEQIEASAEPVSPPTRPDVKPVVAAAAPSAAPQAEVQALAGPQPSPELPSTEAVVTPASLVTQEVAAPVPPPAEIDARRGYGFLNVSSGADTAARLSGENVSSMFVMTKPIPTGAAAPMPSDQAMTTAAVQSGEPVPAPAPKPQAVKPVATAAAAKPAPKTATAPKPAGQAAPAPQEAQAAPADGDAADVPPAETAEAAIGEPVPLTRRQRRLLRKQQEQAPDPSLPWLR